MAGLALKKCFSLKFKQCASIISSETSSKTYLHLWINLEFLKVLRKLIRDVRHRENLLQTENGRVGRNYHSGQIRQMGTISFLCSDFNEIITERLICPFNKWTWDGKCWSTLRFYRKKSRNLSSKILKVVHGLIIFGWSAFFALWRINSIILERDFEKAEKSGFNFGRQQNFDLRAAGFRVVWCICK